MKNSALESFNKLFKELIIPRRTQINEKFSMYMRLYTHAIHAENRMNKHYYKKAFYHLRILDHFTREVKDYEEEDLLKYIHTIVEDILEKEQEIIELIKKGKDDDPLHSTTRLLIIENLCLLRILRELLF